MPTIQISKFKQIAVVVLQRFKFCFAAYVQFFVAILENLYSFLYLFLYGSSCFKYGSKLVLEIVDERCIVVADFFYHEIKGVIGIFQIQLLVSYFGECLTSEYFDVFYLSESATIPNSPSKIQQVAQVQVARNPSNQNCQIAIGRNRAFFLRHCSVVEN